MKINLQKHLGIIAVLIALLAVYLALTYFSPEGINQRETEFYAALALETGQAMETDWREVLPDFDSSSPAMQQSLKVDLEWLKGKRDFILADINSLELSGQGRLAAQRMLALSLVNKYILILNLRLLENGTNVDVRVLEEELKHLDREITFFDFDWQETAGFTEEEINDQASIYMNDFLAHRLTRILKAGQKEQWRVESVKLIELDRLLDSIETA